jgi:tellurite resistance protein TehA-like permease
MAVLIVGAATLLLGRDVIGLRTAIDLDWICWFAGTIAGLAVVSAIPFRDRVNGAFGGWLMPVVPPMVSASTGALLVPHAPAGAPRVALLIACYGLFALSLVASTIVIALIVRRVLVGEVGPARLVPTLWIVLGPLGQSITAVNLLAGAAVGTVPQAAGLRTFALAYSIPVWCLALLWAGVAAAITVRTARAHLPFSLTWWSFTFPVGTCVTGTTGIALHTGSAFFRVSAVVLYGALVAAWLLVAVRTAREAARGRLFLPVGLTA